MSNDTPVEIVLVPAGRGCFDVLVAGEMIVQAARVPVCEAARELLARGVNPAAPLVMRHAGSDIVSMRGTVGRFAKLTVEENERTGPLWRKWKPFPQKAAPSRAVAAPAAVSNSPAPTPLQRQSAILEAR